MIERLTILVLWILTVIFLSVGFWTMYKMQIPASATPKPDPNAFTFSKLMEAYHSCHYGNIGPDVLVVSHSTYAAIVDTLNPEERFFGTHYLQFMGLDVIPSPYIQLDTIQFINRIDGLNPHINKTFRLSELA